MQASHMNYAVTEVLLGAEPILRGRVSSKALPAMPSRQLMKRAYPKSKPSMRHISSLAGLVAGSSWFTGRVRRAATRLGGFDSPAKPAKKRSKTPSKKLKPVKESQIKIFNEQIMQSLDTYADELIKGLRDQGWWSSEGPTLPASLLRRMRKEVESLWKNERFDKSQSVVGGRYYDKEHVFATEITGTTYEMAPCMGHYTVNITRELVRKVREAFPELQLDATTIGNKLNMCIGKGAHFDAHLDVTVQEKPFNRRLSLLLYLNDWEPSMGGEIELLGRGSTEEEAALDPERGAAGLPTTITPISGRWIAFWSDTMLHKVRASQAPRGESDYRVSYVIWLCDKDVPKPSEVKPNTEAESIPSFAAF